MCVVNSIGLVCGVYNMYRGWRLRVGVHIEGSIESKVLVVVGFVCL